MVYNKINITYFEIGDNENQILEVKINREYSKDFAYENIFDKVNVVAKSNSISCDYMCMIDFIKTENGLDIIVHSTHTGNISKTKNNMEDIERAKNDIVDRNIDSLSILIGKESANSFRDVIYNKLEKENWSLFSSIIGTMFLRYYYKDELLGTFPIIECSESCHRKLFAKVNGIKMYDKIIFVRDNGKEDEWNNEKCRERNGFESTEFNIEL